MLGHELRSPLSTILHGLTALRMSGDEPALRERLRCVVERQIGHMARLVNDLLDVARIERGEIPLKVESFDARAALELAIEACEPMLEAKGHRLKKTGFERPVRIRADPTRVAQMATNLLNNAIKYTPEGGCVALALSAQKSQARIEVSDNGVGLSTEALTRIFDMFSQVDDEKRRSDGGLGIGLALTRRLAELQAGSVRAASEGAGKGCRFTIELPLDEREPEETRLN